MKNEKSIGAMRLAEIKVTFMEIPTEANLTLWISGCPRSCAGCQNSELQQSIGVELTEEMLDGYIRTKGKHCTCVCFLGGEQFESEFIKMMGVVIRSGKKVALYTGAESVTNEIAGYLDYLKVGPWEEARGPLTSHTTNQRLWRKRYGDEWEDITSLFWN